MNVGILSETLNIFVAAFSGGFDRLRPAINGLLHILLSLDVLFFGLMVLFDIEPVKGGLRKLFVWSVWAYAISNFDNMATALVDSLVQAGFTAAGQGGASPRQLLNPSLIMDGAFKATQPIADQVLKVKWYSIDGTYMLFGFTLFSMFFAYFLLALNAFIAIIEYYMALSIAGILLPFGVLGPTKWIAMKPLSYFLACGLKLMVVAFLAAISRDILGRVQFSGDEPTFREMTTAVCVSGTLGMLSWLAPQRLAAGIMAGAASFGAGDIARHASGALGVASFATSPLRGPAAQAAVKGVGKGLLLGGAALAGGVGAAYGAMRSAFQGKPAAPAPQKPAATQAAMVQASPHVASAVAVNRTGSRGPVFEGEFVEPTAAVQRRSSAPSGAGAADPALPYRPPALPATSSALPAGNSSSS